MKKLLLTTITILTTICASAQFMAITTLNKVDGIKATPVKKIISGAQTGADLGGLEAGLKLKLETGGTMPIAFQDEKGVKPDYAKKYGVTEYVSQAEGNKILSQPTEKFEAGSIKVPRGAGLNIKRKMTPTRKKKALEGDSKEQVNWLKEELQEFVKEQEKELFE